MYSNIDEDTAQVVNCLKNKKAHISVLVVVGVDSLSTKRMVGHPCMCHVVISYNTSTQYIYKYT
jgi:hypothetical protein